MRIVSIPGGAKFHINHRLGRGGVVAFLLDVRKKSFSTQGIVLMHFVAFQVVKVIEDFSHQQFFDMRMIWVVRLRVECDGERILDCMEDAGFVWRSQKNFTAEFWWKNTDTHDNRKENKP